MYSIARPILRLAARVLPVVVLMCAPIAAYPSSTIAGVVYDNQRNPVHSVDLELLNEVYSLLLKSRTDGAGRYEFNNLPDGRYYIRVLPLRYNLQETTQEVVVTTVSLLGNGNSYINQDFYLKSRTSGSPNLITGVYFAQEIPPDAKEHYDEGVLAFENKNTEAGISNLMDAIKVFPTYFEAHQKLGLELMKLGRFDDAAKLFIRAAEVNPKSASTFYNMGMAFHSLGKEYNKGALVALEKARILAPQAYLIEFQMGKILRMEGDFVEAEKHLLKAKKLAEPRDPQIHKELAQLYGNDLKEYGKAADELELYMKASNQNDKKMKAQIEDLRKKAKESS